MEKYYKEMIDNLSAFAIAALNKSDLFEAFYSDYLVNEEHLLSNRRSVIDTSLVWGSSYNSIWPRIHSEMNYNDNFNDLVYSLISMTHGKGLIIKNKLNIH